MSTEESKEHNVKIHDEEAGDLSQRKLFIGGVSWETNEESFKEFFSKYGEVEECILKSDPLTGQPRGFGFITFVHQKSIKLCLHDTLELDGRRLDPKLAVPRSEQNKTTLRTKKIFVGGLSTDSTQDDFDQYFRQFGEIEDSIVMIDPKTGRNRGFGYVTFESERVVDCICAQRHHELNSKNVECKRAVPREIMSQWDTDNRFPVHNKNQLFYPPTFQQISNYDNLYSYQQYDRTSRDRRPLYLMHPSAYQQITGCYANPFFTQYSGNTLRFNRRNRPLGRPPSKTKKIFIGGLTSEITQDDLTLYFEQFGGIEDCIIMYSPDRKSRGFGFVTFESEDTVDLVTAQISHQIKEKPIDVKKAVPKNHGVGLSTGYNPANHIGITQGSWYSNVTQPVTAEGYNPQIQAYYGQYDYPQAAQQPFSNTSTEYPQRYSTYSYNGSTSSYPYNQSGHSVNWDGTISSLSTSYTSANN